jgi:hypothetical protein
MIWKRIPAFTNAFFVLPRTLLADRLIKMLNWLLMTDASQEATIIPHPASVGNTVRRMHPTSGTIDIKSTIKLLLLGKNQHAPTPIQMM